MRILFDIVHPAHVHFYRHMIDHFTARGHELMIASREKDVTIDLLDAFGLKHVSISHVGHNRRELAKELVARDQALFRLAREFRPHVILTRSPSGTHVGRFLGIPTVFDTDNGRSAGIHYWASAPFASRITTPDCFSHRPRTKLVQYPSYKALAFLHPNNFTPDPGVHKDLQLGPTDRYFIVRLVSMGASHDQRETGMSQKLVVGVLDLLKNFGQPFISSESPLPDELLELRLPTRPAAFHDVLASASLCIGDSGSVAQEAALLGVPSIFVSSFAGRTAPINELEERFGLIRSFEPYEGDEALRMTESLMTVDHGEFQRVRSAMLKEKIDLAWWYVRMVERFVST